MLTLETRVPLNLNVLDAAGVPRVMNLKEALQAFLDHRQVVLRRRAQFRLDAIARRSEILRGFMIVYVNLDEVIRIIREYDDAKERMIKRWKLTDTQAEAILDMRLRALRRLEELAIKKELDSLAAEERELTALLADERKQWKTLGAEMADIKKAFGQATLLGKRRTMIGEPPAEIQIPVEALIEREPVTVLCSAKGWIRAVKGHNPTLADLRFKEGDEGRFAIEAHTTDKLLLFGSNGRFYTLGVDKLPGGRGHGEPVRLMIELGNEHDIVAMLLYREGQKLLLASSDGRGFVVPVDEALGQTRAGKVVMNPADDARALVALPAEGDTVAVIGDNQKLLIFPLSEVPEMVRGRGVILQRYKDGGLADAKVFNKSEGLPWQQEGRVRTLTEFARWQGERAQAGLMKPSGYSKSNKFG